MRSKSSVQIASLVRGEVSSVKHLSPWRERIEVLLAAGAVGAAVAGSMLLVVALGARAHRVFFAPVFLGAWLGAGSLAVALAVRRARERAARYSIGADIDCDAFGPIRLDLVRRAGDGYEIAFVPGMTGTFENGRAPLPVEGLTRPGPVRVGLPQSGRAEIVFGASMFVVRWTVEPVERPAFAWRRFTRLALASGLAAGLASFSTAVPAADAITDADLRSAIPSNATPWEVEKLLRLQAQDQSHSMGKCFDPMPMECMRNGFVGVGLGIDKDGEVTSRWVSRSTYGADCPVAECMADTAARFFFEPLPEPMRVILPVQVLRTGRRLLTLTDASATE